MAETVTARDGVEIAYETHGAGAPALVFVHGWSCDRRYWREQIASFSRTHQVVTVDLGGHGESGLGRETWTIEAFGGDVAAVADELGLERVVLIGHSMGGDVIVQAARRLPERVDGLVWVDTYKQLRSRRSLEEIEQALAPFRVDFEGTTRALVGGMFPPDADAALVDWVVGDMSAAPPDVAIPALESSWMHGRDVTVRLAELQLPVVAINPDDAPTDVESLESHGVEVEIMPGASHFLMMEDPERFNTLLAEVVEAF